MGFNLISEEWLTCLEHELQKEAERALSLSVTKAGVTPCQAGGERLLAVGGVRNL